MSGQRESVQTYWVNGSTEISKRASDLASASTISGEQIFESKGNAGEFVVQGAQSVQFWNGSVRSGENYIGDTKGDGVVFLKEGIQMVVKGGKVLGPLPAGTLHRCNTPPRSRSPTHRIVHVSTSSSCTTQRPPHLPRSLSANNNNSSSYRLASGSERRVSGSGGGHGTAHHDAVVGSGIRYVSGTSHALPPANTHTTTTTITPPKLPRSASYHPHVPPTNTFPSVSVSRECRQCLEQQQQRRESHSRDNHNHHHATYQPAPYAATYQKRHDGDTFSTAPTYLTSGPAKRDWLDDDSIAPEDSISNVGIYPNGYPSGHAPHVSSRR
ncbi:uncharacterized protein B0T23DRAFT_4508 [Neurospora hispaniola]|uniref:Uncharacterized protein n=1 Tax=Neurospora hispaniola TaxID=588809 RepID=A0AAJ0IEN4_9PEZI|nr:hypothetical protein B0T23DRAFT_4508 [Neurospora hispaniola]